MPERIASAAHALTRAATNRRVTILTLGIVTLALCVRLAFFLSRHSVDVFYWDQWDFLDGFFTGEDLWTLFRWQHGPHRQGLAAPFLKVVYAASAWSSRAEAFSVAGVLLLTTGLAWWLECKLFAGLTALDAALAPVVLSMGGYEVLVNTPNPAHGPLAILGVVGLALAFCLRSAAARTSLAIVLNFCATHTGFGVFVGVVTPFLFFVDVVKTRDRDRIWAAGGFIAALATLAFFFKDYRPQTASECFQFPHEKPYEYVIFMGFQLARALARFDDNLFTRLLGIGAALAAVIFTAYASCRFARTRSDVWRTIFLFSAFSVLFSMSSALGRVCNGVHEAFASRYVMYAAPLLLAFYFAAQTLHSRWRSPLLITLAAVFIGKEIDTTYATRSALPVSEGKRRWVECYKRAGNADECDRETGFQIYPTPAATRLDAKLAFLREHGYGPFR